MSVTELVEKLNPSVRIGWKRSQFNVENHAANLKARLNNLVANQESFNMIIMGPPGCGKNTFFESCIFELKSNREFYERRRIIRLNGLVCGRQIKNSINEIFRQLKVSADLLNDDNKRTTFDDRLDSIMELLRSKLSASEASKTSKIYIFVLDKLEYFCEGVQLLLYNLFDACASQGNCLGVVGITSRVDITEMFEKRVKSRFSHRIINLAGGRTFEEYLTMTSGLMQLDNREDWNRKIIEIMKHSQAQRILRMLYDTDKSVGRLSLFLYEVALISESVSDIVNSMTQAWTNFNTSSKVQQCLDLSIFDLMLILAIKLIHPDPFQFDTLWQQISKLAAQYRLERSDMKNSFQVLESIELILPIKERGKQGKKQSENTFYRSNIGFNDLTTVLSTYPQLPSAFQEYGCI